MTSAVIIPAAGTVVYREDGSVAIVDRNRQQFIIHAELVDAIVRLVKRESLEGWVPSDD